VRRDVVAPGLKAKISIPVAPKNRGLRQATGYDEIFASALPGESTALTL
jgi:hypothetical protein